MSNVNGIKIRNKDQQQIIFIYQCQNIHLTTFRTCMSSQNLTLVHLSNNYEIELVSKLHIDR